VYGFGLRDQDERVHLRAGRALSSARSVMSYGGKDRGGMLSSMGLKHQSVSDPMLAKDHEAGEPIRLIQHAEHAQFGTITYEARRLWHLHHEIARSGYVQLRQLHQQVLRLAVAPSCDRVLTASDRPDLMLLVYVAGTQMVLNTVLTMQHFCQEIEHALDAELQRTEIGDRTREAVGLAGLTVATAGPGYSALREIIERRDAVEHPKRKNVFNSHPNDWDSVPMSWFLTERASRSFERWYAWFADAAEQWGHHPVAQPRTLTLTISGRGVRSTRQSKKPPE
jgi:hypothetical protein